MKIIQRSRRGGKTFELAQWVKANTDRVVVVHSQREAHSLEREFDVPVDQIMLAGLRMHERLRGRRNVEIAVDNVDLVLGAMFGNHTPVLGTVTTED